MAKTDPRRRKNEKTRWTKKGREFEAAGRHAARYTEPKRKTTRHKQKVKSKLMSSKTSKPKKELKEINVEGVRIYTDDPGKLSRIFRKRLGAKRNPKTGRSY